jgi:hypothetical protein
VCQEKGKNIPSDCCSVPENKNVPSTELHRQEQDVFPSHITGTKSIL